LPREPSLATRADESTIFARSDVQDDHDVGAALANGSEPRPWLLHRKISFAGGAEERANRVDPERCSAKRVTGAGVRA